MSENDGKIHTVYMRDPLKIKSQNLPYKKTDLYGEISRGLPGPCRDLVLVANSLLTSPLTQTTHRSHALSVESLSHSTDPRTRKNYGKSTV